MANRGYCGRFPENIRSARSPDALHSRIGLKTVTEILPGVVFSERVLLGGKIVETGGERRNTDLRSTETKRQRDLSGEVGASAFGVGGNVKAHDKTGTEASEKGRSTAREGGTTRTVVGGDALVFRRDNREK